MPFHIAIDGPVAAGKGTVSRLVAEKLGFLYVDTGAMYRMTALLAQRKNVELGFDQEKQIVELVKNSTMDMRAPENGEKDGRLSTIFLDSEDVSWKIRTEKVSFGSSAVAKLPQVRKILVKKQQEIAINKDVVMEGRDITYRVLPKANLKIFLTGSDEVRTKRRFNQLLTKGQDVSFEKIHLDLMKRDKQDMNRTTDPLKKIPKAWEIDTSNLSIIQVVEMIVAKTNEMMKK